MTSMSRVVRFPELQVDDIVAISGNKDRGEEEESEPTFFSDWTGMGKERPPVTLGYPIKVCVVQAPFIYGIAAGLHAAKVIVDTRKWNVRKLAPEAWEFIQGTKP